MDIIQRQTDYALRVVLYLGANSQDSPTSVRRLAEVNEVPEEFLRKIAQALSAAGIVRTERGRRGGLRLARPASEISLLDVMEALDAGPSVNRCFADETICGRRGNCVLRQRLAAVQSDLLRVFAGVSLAEMMETHSLTPAGATAGQATTN